MAKLSLSPLTLVTRPVVHVPEAEPIPSINSRRESNYVYGHANSWQLACGLTF